MCIVCILAEINVYGVYNKMNSMEIIKILEKDGWIKHNQKGSHCQYKHPTKKGKVTVPHPKRDLPKKTVASIFKQAGLNPGKE